MEERHAIAHDLCTSKRLARGNVDQRSGRYARRRTLAKINQLPPAERQATLVREAKNERTVIWYAPMNRESLREFTSVFETEYPFLKLRS